MAHDGMFRHTQSPRDSPCRVLGEAYGRSRTPLLSMSKWNRTATLLFKTEFPGERVKTVKNQPDRTVLITSGRQHVYRHLDDGNIEYDIVLSERPPSPVFKIPLEKPRGLSFHKQGQRYSHLMNDDVEGSYAVYWKNRGHQYKTGKFCHIYRPKIIDAEGRWIWGELDYDGDALYITVDENWLKKARYPVTVDPRIGSDSVGASSYNFPESEYDTSNYTYEQCLMLQRGSTPTALVGDCSLNIYAFMRDRDAGGYPGLYDGGHAFPNSLISNNNSFIDLSLLDYTPKWISTNFNVGTLQPPYSELWFGLYGFYMFIPCFDEVEGERVFVGYPYPEPDPMGTPVQASIGNYYDHILLSMFLDYSDSTTWNVKIEGRIKPDEVIDFRAEYNRLEESSLETTDAFQASRGIIRLLDMAAGLTDQLFQTVFYQRAASSALEITATFVRRFSSFIRIFEDWSVWDVFKSFRSHASEELILYSPVTLSMDLRSTI